MRNEFFADSQGALLVYDVTNRKSFESLNAWVKEWHTHGDKSMKVIVCANKVDMGSARQVSEADGKKWAAKSNFVYLETSAADGQNVNEMFHELFALITGTPNTTSKYKDLD